MGSPTFDCSLMWYSPLHILIGHIHVDSHSGRMLSTKTWNLICVGDHFLKMFERPVFSYNDLNLIVHTGEGDGAVAVWASSFLIMYYYQDTSSSSRS